MIPRDDRTWLLSLLSYMEPNIASTAMFLDTTKEIWEVLASMYAPQENICHVYRLCKEIFGLRQEDKSLLGYYHLLKGK